jgi:hypothetical protein
LLTHCNKQSYAQKYHIKSYNSSSRRYHSSIYLSLKKGVLLSKTQAQSTHLNLYAFPNSVGLQ